jgi:hopanoid biosynthesis associated protein HpnK
MVSAARHLIVTADDFGVDIRVNEAVELAFTQGILTSASLMMGGDAVADAVERARRLKGLAVGLHITLADGRPVLPRKRIPDLVDRDGRFRNDLFRSGMNWFFKPDIRRQVKAEIDAQFAAFIRTGLVLDHANAHKHLHLHPTIAGVVARIGRRYGLTAMRIPAEPRRIIKRAEPGQAVPRALLWPVLAIVRRRARAADLIVNDHMFGLAWTGALTEARLLALIPHLPAGVSELYAHPATATAEEMPHAAPGYRYRDELAALTSPAVKTALVENGVSLTRFSALASALRPDGAEPRARTA